MINTSKERVSIPHCFIEKECTFCNCGVGTNLYLGDKDVKIFNYIPVMIGRFRNFKLATALLFVR